MASPHEFDGRLIDDVLEARYLGRLVQDFAAVHGQPGAVSQPVLPAV